MGTKLNSKCQHIYCTQQLSRAKCVRQKTELKTDRPKMCVAVCHLLTSCIAVKQKWVLKLKVQVFGDWLCQVLHTESVHNGETMSGRCQPEMQRGQSTERHLKNSCDNELISDTIFTWLYYTDEVVPNHRISIMLLNS